MTTQTPSKRQKMCPPNEALPSLSQDIWVGSILPFIGVGHFADVAAVSRQMKQYYNAYCDTVKDPPKKIDGFWGTPYPVTNVDTFYSGWYD
jgi:hypothetical protein